MTSSAGKGDATGARRRAAAGPGIAGELQALDSAPLDQLLEIRAQEARLEEYRQRAAEKKDAVPEAVWKRVVDDYARRTEALARKAAPLRTQVRLEYRKLRALLDRATALRGEAELQKAELEFRHEVGELNATELQDGLRVPTQTLEQCDSDLAAIGDHRARFLAAFASEADLDMPATEARGPETGVLPAATQAAQVDAGASDLETTLPPAGVTAPGRPTPATGRHADATRLVPAIEDAPAPADGTMAGDPSEHQAERTFIMPLAALLISVDGAEPQTYRLAAVNYIGRSGGSHIVLARPGVSRQHARISATPAGFTLQDLGSQNGTLVNGVPVTEHALKDEDQIGIADATLTFRMPWPAGA